MDRSEVPDLKPLITPPRTRRYKLLILLGVVALLLQGGVYVAQRLNSPVVGVVHAPKVASEPAPSSITVHGKTVTFTYPDTLKRINPSNLAPNETEKFLFINGQYNGWTLAIQIKQLPGGLLANNSSYTLRQRAPQQYKEEKVAINGMNVSIMADQNVAGNKVAFIPHANLVAEIALTNGDDAQSQQLFTDLLESWQWL